MSFAGLRNGNAVLTISVIHLFGINAMYGLIYRNGYLQSMLNLYHQGPYVLPLSNTPILTRYTGLWPLDKLLTLAMVMTANITDGSTPQLSLYSFQLAGQLVSVFTVLMIEGHRLGNRRTVIGLPLLWGLAMQIVGYGFVMPLYAITFLLSSSTASKADPSLAQVIPLRDDIFLETIPLAMVLGYIVPTILISLPFTSPVLHQWLWGLWQGFPLWVTLIHHALRIVYQKARRVEIISELGRSKSTRPAVNANEETKMLYRAYVFAFGISAATHIATFSTLCTRKLFPALFTPLAQRTLNFTDVFLPPTFYTNAPMENLAIGIQNFFQYDQYVGSTAALAWAAALHCNSRTMQMTLKHWAWLAGEITCVGVCAGPGAALVTLMWNRDERILCDDELHNIFSELGWKL